MTKNDVFGIVVTYHPDSQFAARLSRVVSQVDALVIVDNGSTDSEIHMLQRIAAEPGSKVKSILNSDNLGIARALNIGVQQAAAQGYPWALLLDQDSVVNMDMVEVLLAAFDSFTDKDHLAVVGAGYREPRSDSKPNPDDRGNTLWSEVELVITSGSLLSLAAYAAIGPFREEFFIDHVDSEYCLRARAGGYRIINTVRPLMEHAVGAPSVHKLFNKTKLATNHSADRRYYFARNDTILLRESGNYTRGTWILKSFGRRFRTVKRIVLFETAKIEKIRAVIQGWWDGINGTMGVRIKRS